MEIKTRGSKLLCWQLQGRSVHQLGYLLAGARVLLMERSDHSCQSSFGLRDINLPPVVKALPMQNDSGLFTCTLEFNVAQLLPLNLSLLFPWHLIHLFIPTSWTSGTTLRAVTGLVDVDAELP